MNTKQVAAVILVVGALVLIQFGLSLDKGAKAKAAEVVAQTNSEEKLRAELKINTDDLSDVRRQSEDLLQFVGLWEPYFALTEERSKAESGISMKVREAGILNLSQKYEDAKHEINNKPVAALPKLVRATLIFEDNYGKVLKWMGRMEKIRPTMRVGRVELAKGSRGDDLRMDLVLEIPLRNKKQQ